MGARLFFSSRIRRACLATVRRMCAARIASCRCTPMLGLSLRPSTCATCLAVAMMLSPPAQAQQANTPETQHVEVTAPLPGARDQKTLAQLLAAQDAFARHRALAPAATLGFRLYARLDPRDLEHLRLFRIDGQQRHEVPLDDHQRFTLDPAWTRADADRGVLLQTNLPDGAVAWKVDVRTPGIAADRRRLGDLRLECEADTFHGNLQRGLRTPVSAILDASDELCRLDDAQAWFAERPIFGVALVDGARRRTLPYGYLHGSTGTMALAALFDWPWALRDRAYFLPLADASWPDDTAVVFDAMDDPQPEPAP
jgi:hypothetical protein